jgi:hypothetical protein
MIQSWRISYIDGICSTCEGMGNVLTDLMEQSQGNSQLGRGGRIIWTCIDVNFAVGLCARLMLAVLPMFWRCILPPCSGPEWGGRVSVYVRTHSRVCGHRSGTNPRLCSLESVGQNPVQEDSPALLWLHPVDVGSMRLRNIGITDWLPHITKP